MSISEGATVWLRLFRALSTLWEVPDLPRNVFHGGAKGGKGVEA